MAWFGGFLCKSLGCPLCFQNARKYCLCALLVFSCYICCETLMFQTLMFWTREQHNSSVPSFPHIHPLWVLPQFTNLNLDYTAPGAAFASVHLKGSRWVEDAIRILNFCTPGISFVTISLCLSIFVRKGQAFWILQLWLHSCTSHPL